MTVNEIVVIIAMTRLVFLSDPLHTPTGLGAQNSCLELRRFPMFLWYSFSTRKFTKLSYSLFQPPTGLAKVAELAKVAKFLKVRTCFLRSNFLEVSYKTAVFFRKFRKVSVALLFLKVRSLFFRSDHFS